jgi:RsiW-degrading membrane proteinase PrsW (M82 family)
MKRFIAIRRGDIVGYMIYNVLRMGSNLNPWGFFGALLILAVWFLFLVRLDVFEPEKIRWPLITLFLGMLTPFFATILYDIYRFAFHFELTGGWINDLAYSIVGIGFIEEFAKIIPLFIILKYTREINESIDYILYACMAALGFAFMENLLYFDEYNLYIIQGRGFISVVGHMLYSSIIGYGLMLAHCKGHGKYIRNFIVSFLIAATVHGLFDYWIFMGRSEFYPVMFLSFFIAVYGIIVFNRIINNALNQSEYFSMDALKKLNTQRHFLGYAFAAILIYEYLALAWTCGPNLAWQSRSTLMIFNWGLIYFLAFSLGTYTVTPKVWLPVLRKKKEIISLPEATEVDDT